MHRMIIVVGLLAACGEVRTSSTDGPSDASDAAVPDLSLALSPNLAAVRQGGTISIQVIATRGAGITGPIVLELVDLPTGVTADAVTVPADQRTAALLLRAISTAPQGGPKRSQVRGTVGNVSTSVDLPVVVMGPVGTFDLSFGNGGTTLVDYAGRHDNLSALALGPDGGIAIGGTTEDSATVILLLARLSALGALDNTFDQDGKLTLNLTVVGQSQTVDDIVFQPDGKMIFCGNTAGDFLVGRLNQNGSFDTSFNASGYFTRDFLGQSQFDQCLGVVIQADGKIVAAGISGNSNGSSIVAVRLTAAEGALDPTFGSGGIFTVPQIGAADRADAIALTSTGSIVLAGSTTDSVGHQDVAVVRLTGTGAIDSTFGSAGTFTVNAAGGGPTGPADGAYGLAIQPDGAIVLVGSVDRTPGGLDYLVLRLLPQGGIDRSFATQGFFYLDWFGSNDVASGVALQSDGKIAVVGSIFHNVNASSADHGLIRLTPQGNLDSSFGQDGQIDLDLIPSNQDVATQIRLLPDNRWVVGGTACSAGNCDLSVIRIWP